MSNFILKMSRGRINCQPLYLDPSHVVLHEIKFYFHFRAFAVKAFSRLVTSTTSQTSFRNALMRWQLALTWRMPSRPSSRLTNSVWSTSRSWWPSTSTGSILSSIDYSGYMKSALVWIPNGQKEVGLQLVWILNFSWEFDLTTLSSSFPVSIPN